MNIETNFEKRKNTRLPGYDYSSAGAYFITICAKDRRNLFGKIIVSRNVGDAHQGVPHVCLSGIGNIIKKHIDGIPMVYDNVVIDKYIIMPNHIHIILTINTGIPGRITGTPGCASPTGVKKSVLAKVVNALKGMTTRQFGSTLWQRSYYDHIIRDEEDYQRIWQYIDDNPARWADDEYFAE